MPKEFYKFFLFFLIILSNPISSQEKINNTKESNIKTFSGPMGMGLVKSFEIDRKKVCIYNTVNGQKKLIFDKSNISCPKFLKKDNRIK